MKMNPEILAPAGSMDSLIAAVRCGAGAVYLGGTSFNARQGAQNFDKASLMEAVSYCRARGVSVHLTLNTIVFDDELEQVERAIKEAAEAGVDAFIIQDLAVFKLAKECAPTIERHASTQLSVHNIQGVLQLAEMGFHRAVLARELTLSEITAICKESPIAIECFIHGALCVSMSGQCYVSSMIGGRSGNRGRCAQTCRLPFANAETTHALSLKDLSVIEYLPTLLDAGVLAYKIEGRLKRPEYVAAAVTACKKVANNEVPDYATLQAIFSRSGFTEGYLQDEMSDKMFGTRTKEDVTSAGSTLKELASLYRKENPLVSVDLTLTMKKGESSILTGTVGELAVTVNGAEPQEAISAPTTQEKATVSLSKMGNTPFYLGTLICHIEDGLMLPASQLNSLRRDLLEILLAELERPTPKEFIPYQPESKRTIVPCETIWRIRLQRADQLWEGIDSEEIVLPLSELPKLSTQQKDSLKDKLILELPRVAFREEAQVKMRKKLERAKEEGFLRVLVGDLGGLHLAQSVGMILHGDFGLNVVNGLSASEYSKLGCESITLSMEYAQGKERFNTDVKVGILVYGELPVMMFRNHPAGLGGENGTLTDRLGNQFRVVRQGEVSVMHNCVPLFLADRLSELKGCSFFTLYFTEESREKCREIFGVYKEGGEIPKPYTRGLYQKRIQ